MGGKPLRVLVGRHSERAELAQLLNEIDQGHGGVLVVAGEAGTGKTTLARELREAAVGRGFTTLWGACVHFASARVPYVPLVRAVEDWTESGQRGDPLVAVADSLFVPAPGEPGELDVVRGTESLLRTLASAAPTLLVVDDLQWADTATLDVLAFVASGVRRQRLGVLLLLRTEDLPIGSPLHEWLADVRRLDGITELALSRMTEDETFEQVAGLREAASFALARAVHERTGGNPYFTELLLEGMLPGTSALPLQLPVRLRDAVLARWHALSPDTRWVARVLAIGGRARPVEILSEVVTSLRADIDLRGSLGEAIDKGVVVRHAVDTVWLRHPLLREVLVTEVASGHDDGATHLAYAEVLARTAGDDPVAAGDVSEHLAAGRDADGAFHWALVAADLAVEVGAPTQAYLGLALATDLWPTVSEGTRGDELDHVDLLRRAARAEWSIGVEDRGSAWLAEAVSILERRDDPVLLAEVLLQRSGQQDFELESSTSDLRRAVGLVDGRTQSDTCVAVLSEYANAQWVQGDRAAAATTARRALELATGSGDRALAWATYASATVGGSGDRADRMGEAYRLAQSAGDPMCMAYAAAWWERLLRDAGRYDEQVAAAVRIAAELRAAGDLEGPKWLAADAAGTLVMTGEWARARTLLRGPFATGTRSSGDVGLAWAAALLAVRTGQPGLAGRQVDRLLEIGAPTNWQWPLAQPVAELALATGRPWDALQALDSRHEPDPWQTGAMQLHVALAAAACADLAEGSAHPEILDPRALATLEALRTWADDCAAFRRDTRDRRQEALWEARTMAEEARLRWALSGSSDAEVRSDCVDAFSAFRSHARRDGFPWEDAYGGLRLAEAMIRERTPHHEVAAVLREAHARAVGLGADHLAARLSSLARATRISLEAVREDLGSSVPVDPLTPREREVLAHLVAGRTNAEIAAALFLSVKTVGIHVSNVLRKTGTHSRGEAALWATRTDRAAADGI